MRLILTRPTRRQRGYTLFEVGAAMAAMSLLILPMTSMYARQQQQRQINKAINEVMFIGEAGQNFFIDNGSFPDQANNCAAAIAQLTTSNYLGGGGAASPYGTNYTTSCTASVFSITVTAPSDNIAAQVASGVPRSTRAGAQVVSAFALPGAVPGLRAYLRRTVDPAFADANRMETSINMTGNNLNNVGTISANGANPLTLNATGGVNVAGGNLNVANARFATDQGGSLELGGNNAQAGSGTPYIDFHTTGGGTVDFNARIQAPAANQLSMIAAGRIDITTADLNTSGNVTATGRVRANDVQLSSLGNFSLQNTVQDVRLVEHGNTIPKPTCPTGKTQGLVLAAERVAESATPSAFYGWRAQALDQPGNPNNWIADVAVFTGLGQKTPDPGWARFASMTFCY